MRITCSAFAIFGMFLYVRKGDGQIHQAGKKRIGEGRGMWM
jgi:hypothetical protein